MLEESIKMFAYAARVMLVGLFDIVRFGQDEL